jgi:glucose-6-phosphate isomerase
MQDHHRVLLANCFAQSEALMVGKSAEVVRAELAASGMSDDAIDALTPHKVFHGNRPSSTILMPEVSPRALGALIALYEHKVFTQGVIWNVNSFDQWGVELGKQLAKTIDGELHSGVLSDAHDGSTLALMRRALR